MKEYIEVAYPPKAAQSLEPHDCLVGCGTGKDNRRAPSANSLAGWPKAAAQHSWGGSRPWGQFIHVVVEGQAIEPKPLFDGPPKPSDCAEPQQICESPARDSEDAQ